MKELNVTLIGQENGMNIYEVEVPQDDDTTFAYTISEDDLNRLVTGNKSKWDVKYLASSVREV